jgi:metallophosphoesterase superfamily enzyme
VRWARGHPKGGGLAGCPTIIIRSDTDIGRTVFDAVFRDRAIYLPRGDTLVLADLHVGRAEGSDVEFPLGEASDLADRLADLLAHFDPETVVVAGDVLHQFSRLSDRVAESFDTLVDSCRAAGARPVLVAGNHDAQLDRVWDGDVHDVWQIDLDDPEGDNTAGHETTNDYLPDSLDGPVIVRHGHEAPPTAEAAGAGLYLIGHDHPTIEIEGKRRPCYLYVPDAVGETPAVMLPPFNRLSAGVTVNGMSGTDFQSPFVTAANPLRPVVWDEDSDERLSFPPLGEFRRML